MEPAATIITAILLGGACSAGNATVSVLVKDAYEIFKDRWHEKFPSVRIQDLAIHHESAGGKRQIEEMIRSSGADHDIRLIEAASRSVVAVREEMPDLASSLGIDLTDVNAGSLKVEDVVASGTGVKVERGNFTGDLEIKGVRAGVPRYTASENKD